MQTNLADHLERSRIVALINADVEAFCKEEFADDPRTHLGASIIGHACAAYAWNTFRWLKQEDFEGQKLRLFNRGHLEEHRFVNWLRGIGFEVREFEQPPQYDWDGINAPYITKQGKQFRVVGVKGHFGGSLDTMVKAPARYGIDDPMLCEFKTHNNKSFRKLKKDGVRSSKPEHYSQMCVYGRAYGFRFSLYCAVNKDTDELYFEIVELDWRHADDLVVKADRAIHARSQPPKISKTETFFVCKMCHFTPICHRNEVPEKNCRSCLWAEPVDDAKWHCTNPRAINGELSKEQIATGCETEWASIHNG